MLDSGVIPVVAAPRSRNSGLKRVASGSGLGVCKQGGLSRLSILGPRGGLMGYGFWWRLLSLRFLAESSRELRETLGPGQGTGT